MAHTVTLEPFYKVNGVPITESEIIAISAARYGIPVVMVAGDDVLEGQIRQAFPDAARRWVAQDFSRRRLMWRSFIR